MRQIAAVSAQRAAVGPARGPYRLGSRQTSVSHLRVPPLRVAEPAIKLTKAHRLTKDSTFIDVGSGYGKARS